MLDGIQTIASEAAPEPEAKAYEAGYRDGYKAGWLDGYIQGTRVDRPGMQREAEREFKKMARR